MLKPWNLTDFVRESNRIEGIERAPTKTEIGATEAFLALSEITVASMADLVSAYAPGHVLRDRVGLNVRVGNYVAPPGGPAIATALEALLSRVSFEDTFMPWYAHVAYERLHPFTDGNGRSGRALWLWMHQGQAPIGFLHRFYYETLALAESTDA